MSQESTWNPDRWITDNDRHRSRTSHSLDDLYDVVRAMRPHLATRTSEMLDIGCGYGGLAALVSDYLGFDSVHAMDIDPRGEDEARSKGLEVVTADASEFPLPYGDDQFDLVMTLGMMDYLITFDGLIREINRVTAPGGLLLLTLPNLASWHNRLGLLAGYQPRDIEISEEILAGVAPGYKGETPAGHVHIPTLGAIIDLMEHHGFETVVTTGGRPRQRSVAGPLMMIDRVLSRRPSLARRFYWVGKKTAGRPEIPHQRVDLPPRTVE